MKALIAKAVGVLLILSLAFSLGYSYRDGAADKEALQLQNEHLRQLNAQRERLQGELDEIANTWQDKLKTATGDASRAVAQLRDAGIRLRVQLADARVAAVTGSSGPEPDGRAELHADAAGFLVGQAQRADAQVKALQRVVLALQGRANATEKD